MCLKRLYLCVLLISRFNSSNCILLDSILRLSCDEFKDIPNKICVGTAITQNTAISSTFCAITCNSIIKGNRIIPIIATYSHSRYNKAMIIRQERNQSYKEDDISIIVFKSDYDAGTRHLQSHLKLSAVEPLALIGLKGSMPSIYGDKTKLKTTLILPCDNQLATLEHFVICTSNNYYQRSINKEERGYPLFLNGRIIGVSCSRRGNLLQNVFLAVAPALSWIADTVQIVTVKYTKKDLKMLRSIDAGWAPYSSNAIITATNPNKVTKIALESSHKVEEKSENKTNPSPIVSKLIDTSVNVSSSEGDILSKPDASELNQDGYEQHAGFSIELTSFQSNTTPFPSLLSESTQNSNSISKTITATSSKPTIFTSTDIMQWFLRAKAQIDANPDNMFVLTTARTTYNNLDLFLDLT